jgi:hypothetical protein
MKVAGWTLTLACGLLLQPIGSMADFSVLGPGTVSCAKFAEAYRNSPTNVENLFFAWAEGMMSGVNTAALEALGKYRDLSAMTIKEQQAYLRDYCDQHPLADYSEAVRGLFEKLPLKDWPSGSASQPPH